LIYSAEKARLRALRESLQTAPEGMQPLMAARQVVKAVSPAVVSITTERRIGGDGSGGASSRGREWWRRLLRPDGNTSGLPPSSDDAITVRTGVGSGFVIDAERGYVLTNHHVVTNADIIGVALADGRRVNAEIVGGDPMSDLAVIRIESDGLFDLTIGDSDRLEVGDDVFAVGNPFGFGGSFSRGIVSAMGRSEVPLGGIRYQRFIQTDAVINPGNSGGPLVDMQGEVVGINTAIATATGRYDGVGFAIPASRIKELLPQLLAGGPIRRGFLGIEMRAIEDVRDKADALGWDRPHGVMVWNVTRGQPAERAGIKRFDILIQYDDQPITTMDDVREAVGRTPPGTEVSTRIWREGREQTVRIEVGQFPANL
jgi:serine protease Do